MSKGFPESIIAAIRRGHQNQIRLKARELADTIGADPERWPWPTDTSDGVKAWAEFDADTDRWGLHWAELRLGEMADEVEPGPAPGWQHPEQWTRADFLRHVKMDQADERSGSKGSIAERVHKSPSALWRLWEGVREPDESWPSGNKGPAVRR